MKEYNALPLSGKKYRLAESPFYDPRYSRLSWVDIPEGKIYSRYDDGREEVIVLNGAVGAAVPLRDQRGFLAAGRDGLYIAGNDGVSLLYDLSGVYAPYLRSNDAKADPAGRLWFGSSCDDDVHEAQGALYVYDGTVRMMQPDTKISNGMAWSLSHDRFFFSDSLYHAVFAYDYDVQSGCISGRRVLFGVQNGLPDGMCIDKSDDLWVAVWGGSRVECRSDKGELLAVVNVSALNVTSCAFGGDDMRTLYITTSGDGLGGEYDGCLFYCRVDAQGLAPDTAVIPRRAGTLGAFPAFMQRSENIIPSWQQNTPDIEGYYYTASDGSQMAFWTYKSDRVSAEHTHDYDEYMTVVSGEYTVTIDGAEYVLHAGDELFIPKGSLQGGRVTKGTRSIHAFGGERVKPHRMTRYSPGMKDKVTDFLGAVFLESGKTFDINGRHSIYNDIEANFEYFICLEQKDDIIGTAALKRLNDTDCELKTLYLYSRCHGQGLGRALAMAVIEEAKNRGFERIYLDSMSGYERAMKLYKSLGFTATERYNDNDKADVFMVLELI